MALYFTGPCKREANYLQNQREHVAHDLVCRSNHTDPGAGPQVTRAETKTYLDNVVAALAASLGDGGDGIWVTKIIIKCEEVSVRDKSFVKNIIDKTIKDNRFKYRDILYLIRDV